MYVGVRGEQGTAGESMPPQAFTVNVPPSSHPVWTQEPQLTIRNLCDVCVEGKSLPGRRRYHGCDIKAHMAGD